jgi:hypothetical protein
VQKQRTVSIDEKVADFRARRARSDQFRAEVERLMKQGETRASNPWLNSVLSFQELLDKDIKTQTDRLLAVVDQDQDSAALLRGESGQALDWAYRLAEAGWGPDHPETIRLQALANQRLY